MGAVHANFRQQGVLGFRLDTLRDDHQPEVVRHRHDAAQQGPAVRGDVLGELPVDLQVVEREVADHVEVVVARAEVVHGQADAGVVQAVERFHGCAVVGQQVALGDLHHQPGAGRHRRLQCRQLRREALAPQVQRCHVHGHMERTRRTVAVHVVHGLMQDEARDVVDHRRGFHRFDERRGRDHAPARMAPAQEGFHADGLPRAHRHDRLVGQMELAAPQALPHGLEQQALRRGHDQEAGHGQ
ncbi:hypothetical protein D3C72_998360 [compost metagenome]